jgi:hypothetical protein
MINQKRKSIVRHPGAIPGAILQRLIQRVQPCRESSDESLFSTLLQLEQQIRKDLKTKYQAETKKQGTLRGLGRRFLIIPRSRYVE